MNPRRGEIWWIALDLTLPSEIARQLALKQILELV